MFIVIPCCLLLMLLAAERTTSQTGSVAPHSDIVLPFLRLSVRVIYTTDEATVTQECGKRCAKKFLENIIQTEQALLSKCLLQQSDTHLLVCHDIQARVRLVGGTITVESHTDIRVTHEDGDCRDNASVPWTAVRAGSNQWPGRQDVMQCGYTIRQTLEDPLSFQNEYNLDENARLHINLTTVSVDISSCGYTSRFLKNSHVK